MYICRCLFRRVCFRKRERSCRRICTGSGMGYTWWTGTHCRNVSVCVRLLRHCSAISIQNDIQSYRDLPKVYNQWCSVSKMGERRPVRSFVPENSYGRKDIPAHATAEEAEERTVQMLNLYADFCEEVLAIPVITRTERQRKKNLQVQRLLTPSRH